MRLLDAIPAANGGASLVTAQIDDVRLCYSVAEPGEHWIDNSLAVMATVYAVGGDATAPAHRSLMLAAHAVWLSQLGFGLGGMLVARLRRRRSRALPPTPSQ